MTKLIYYRGLWNLLETIETMENKLLYMLFPVPPQSSLAQKFREIAPEIIISSVKEY